LAAVSRWDGRPAFSQITFGTSRCGLGRRPQGGAAVHRFLSQALGAAATSSLAERGAPVDAGTEDGYEIDTDYAADQVDLVPRLAQAVQYFAPGVEEGVALLDEPRGSEQDRLMPGEIVAAELAEPGFARLLDGRGWLALDDEGVEEVNPWASRLMKKSGIDKTDVNALAYINMESDDTVLSEHLPLPTRVVNELKKRGVSKASPIQEAVFSRVYRGESMCLQSQTGSGKTLAMMLPLLTAMAEESEWGVNGDKIIVVTSCRELAVQLYSDIDSMGFFPQGKGFATLVIIGNLPSIKDILKANVIIGTANELGGYLHKERDIIKQLNTQLRAIVMDEVDSYTTAPRIWASKWDIKRRRKIYNEKKMTLDPLYGDGNTGVIEWFMRRQLAYSRRQDLQVLAASATLTRNMARKVFRLLRWDPLGRWYNNPPPLLRPERAGLVDWQSVPRMPTLPMHLKHRYVPVIKGETDVEISDGHYSRRDSGRGALRRIKVRSATGAQKKFPGLGHRPILKETAAALLDGLHDTLKSRKFGSSMIVVCKTCGVSVRDLVEQLHKWGFYEAEGLHSSLWVDADGDHFCRDAEKYTWDQADHSTELAEKHRQLNDKLRSGNSSFDVGSFAWQRTEARKRLGETTSPIVVGFEGLSRGLHFDGVETVYMLGLPRKPDVYLHLAGRVGRLGQKGGKVVSIVTKRGTKVLDAWSNQIGPEVRFEEERIRRIRSREVKPRDASPGMRRKIRKRVKRRHGPWANEANEEDKWLADRKEEEARRKLHLIDEGDQEPLLLPEGQEEVVTIPGVDENYKERLKDFYLEPAEVNEEADAGPPPRWPPPPRRR